MNPLYYALILCMYVIFGPSSVSAIPVWERLRKQEKMSFLYSLFASQVDTYCEISTSKDCSQDLLRYGLNTLKNIPEDVLDATDPYQKDANNIIWKTILQGHVLAASPPNPKATTTVKPNSYNDDASFGSFGTEGAASNKLDSVHVAAPEGFEVKNEETNTEYSYSNNVTASIKVLDAPVDGKEQHESSQEQDPKTRVSPIGRTPLTGPIVVRVHVNGTPVDEELPFHHDEDLWFHRLTQIPLPDFA